LDLSGNQLTEIPSLVLQMPYLRILALERNLFTQLDPALGNLQSLFELRMSNNPQMVGPIPRELTQLTALFYWDQTGLCVPEDPVVQSWIFRSSNVGAPKSCARLTVSPMISAPGSYVTVRGIDFAPYAAIYVQVNFAGVGQVYTDGKGEFNTTLYTTVANPGQYWVTASSQSGFPIVGPTAGFLLSSDAGVQGFPGVTVLAVPSNIAQPFALFLPSLSTRGTPVAGATSQAQSDNK
jgi:hypothetical protein